MCGWGREPVTIEQQLLSGHNDALSSLPQFSLQKPHPELDMNRDMRRLMGTQ